MTALCQFEGCGKDKTAGRHQYESFENESIYCHAFVAASPARVPEAKEPKYPDAVVFSTEEEAEAFFAPARVPEPKVCIVCRKEITGPWDSYQGDGFGGLLHNACRVVRYDMAEPKGKE